MVRQCDSARTRFARQFFILHSSFFKMRMLFILWLSACWHGGSLLAQLKMERESRVKVSAVPLPARHLIDSCFGATKIKWYVEESINHRTYEAKLKFEDKKYSVEFDTLGVLEDVEHEISLNAIPDSLRQKIETHLGATFKKYKIVKIQEQWVGERAVLHAKIKGRELPAPLVVNYEIVVVGKSGRLYKSFELTFNLAGEVVSYLEIIHGHHQNLIY
jgi:hypothetical protein